MIKKFFLLVAIIFGSFGIALAEIHEAVIGTIDLNKAYGPADPTSQLVMKLTQVGVPVRGSVCSRTVNKITIKGFVRESGMQATVTLEVYGGGYAHNFSKRTLYADSHGAYPLEYKMSSGANDYDWNIIATIDYGLVGGYIDIIAYWEY